MSGRCSRLKPYILCLGLVILATSLWARRSAQTSLSGAALEAVTAEAGDVRLVAIGDLHGDLEQALTCLRLAGVVDSTGAWIAAPRTTLVQMGDIMDRGTASIATLKLFEALQIAASERGSKVELLLGNHEVFNIIGDFRYVSKQEMANFAAAHYQSSIYGPEPIELTPTIDEVAAWSQAFDANEPLGKIVRNRMLISVQGTGECRTLFVHAGMLPWMLEFLMNETPETFSQSDIDEINNKALGVLQQCSTRNCSFTNNGIAELIFHSDGPVWTRRVAMGPSSKVCPKVTEVLKKMNAKQMVMGHTVQMRGKPTVRCGGLVHLIDVGISRSIAGNTAVWECHNNKIAVLQ